jgi:hypothetical protein
MRGSHGPFRPSGVFFRLQFSADYTITMFGLDFRHGPAQKCASPGVFNRLRQRIALDRTSFRDIEDLLAERGILCPVRPYAAG